LALIGSGSVDVTATQSGDTYRTRVAVGVSLSSLMLGNTLPRGASVAQATLDGRPVTYTTEATNRGLEVRAPALASGTRELVVTGGYP